MPKTIFAEMLDRVRAVNAQVLNAAADQSRVVVEPPRDPSHGDMATNAAMVLAKDAGKKPRELADAIAAAVAENPQVEACREKARAAGFEMKVTLEAVVGFVNRSQTAALTKVTTQARPLRDVQQRRTFEVTANDRRFLRSLRIAADETAEPVE